jgi:hypothetical protein
MRELQPTPCVRRIRGHAPHPLGRKGRENGDGLLASEGSGGRAPHSFACKDSRTATNHYVRRIRGPAPHPLGRNNPRTATDPLRPKDPGAGPTPVRTQQPEDSNRFLTSEGSGGTPRTSSDATTREPHPTPYVRRIRRQAPHSFARKKPRTATDSLRPKDPGARPTPPRTQQPEHGDGLLASEGSGGRHLAPSDARTRGRADVRAAGLGEAGR